MNSIKKEMLKIYKPISGLDWLNYRLVKKDLTYHHILKKSDGGKETIERWSFTHAYKSPIFAFNRV